MVPLAVDVQLYDPGHGDDQLLEKWDAHFAAKSRDASAHRRPIRESAEFRPYLTLLIRPELSLPARRRPPGSSEQLPSVRSVRVLLPPEVSVPVSAVRTEGVLDLQVDPRTGALEWQGEAMEPSKGSEEEERKKTAAPRRYRSKPMELHFTRPGELFMQQDLSVEVCVEVPDELLSSTQVRMFTATGADATGHRRVLKPGP